MHKSLNWAYSFIYEYFCVFSMIPKPINSESKKCQTLSLNLKNTKYGFWFMMLY